MSWTHCRSLGEQLSPPPPTPAELARARRELDRLIGLAVRALEPPAPPPRDRPLPGYRPPGWPPGDGYGRPGPGRGRSGR